ncbi:conserved hypothetical protein [Rubrivivax sp. A210]|uniref:hypothetical protein n=1 Tax=Rubrivivax sp. A210 TaxID=2772301 RepID=UPI00191B51A6|nr:hypothetical protein [Rubrivivax sp. A210]CAD5374654.1 conserved hypothetical protein [Rubrivivax sp. A210]
MSEEASAPAAAPTPAPAPAIASQADFVAALRWGFDTAIVQGARQISCVAPSFEIWPWSDADLLRALTDWLRLPQRRLVLLAAAYDDVPRFHPRFVAWRRDWAHAMSFWQAPAEMAAELPTLLLDDRAVSVHLADATHWRGRALVDLRAAHLWRERVDAVLQRSETAFAVNTLGL